jgi:hypothetical protein
MRATARRAHAAEKVFIMKHFLHAIFKPPHHTIRFDANGDEKRDRAKLEFREHKSKPFRPNLR